MNALHAKALQSSVRKLKWLLVLRAGVQWATVWFFLWGVAVLVARISGAKDTVWLALGLLGLAPTVALAGWCACKQLPSAVRFRADYDRLNACGGVIMSEEAADMDAWQAQLPAATAPNFRWRSGRAMTLLSVSTLFVATTLLLPDRLAHFTTHQPLEIGQIADQLHAEVKVLRQEKIIEDKKAEDLQKQLSQIKNDSSGLDPDKTWEALDHIKESDSNAAKQAAEEALAKMTALAQAETLGKAMQQAADTGMSAATATEAARDLAAMLAAAKLRDGLLKVQIPPQLLHNLNGLDKEQLQKLLNALEFNKNSLGLTISNLAQLRLIDPAMLARCNKAGQCFNPDALAAYLATCTNGCNALAECQWLANGGPGGGGPAAPMTWNHGVSEKDLKFQEHVLPPATSLSDAQLVGVSRAAPKLSGNHVVVESGALDSAQGSGGSAYAQVILPEHRQAVQNFFKRDEK